MLSDQFFFVVKGDPLIIGLKGEHPGGIGEGDTVAIGFEADQILSVIRQIILVLIGEFFSE